MPTTKAEFERLAEARLEEARCLYHNGLYDGAYYLAGYAVEFAIKAVLCDSIRAQEMPDPEIERYFVHDLAKLLKYANLSQEIQQAGHPAGRSWNNVLAWSEASRYRGWSQSEARDVIEDVGDPMSGVLTWLRSKW